MALIDFGQPFGASTPEGTVAFRTAPEVPVHRTRFARTMRTCVRQGVFGYLASFAVAVLVLSVLPLGAQPAWATLFLVAGWLVYSFAALAPYMRARSLRPSVRLVGLSGVVTMVAIALGAQSGDQDLRRLMAMILATAGTLATSALVHRRLLRRMPVLLVGEPTSIDRLATRWAGRPDVEVVATAAWVPGPEGSDVDRLVGGVLGAVAAHDVATVVITGNDSLGLPAPRHLAWALERVGVECLVLTDMNEHVQLLEPRRVADQVAVGLEVTNDHLVSSFVKSCVDRSAAFLALVLLSPVLGAIALAIRLDTKGPVVFTQERTGIDGVPFRMFKFRTMVTDAEERRASLLALDEGAGPLFKLEDDPRVTRVGRVLRRTSLDELLQLLNVLNGTMSLVGPRPALPAETAAYDDWVWRRLHVLPGMTGLWQISGRSSLTWEESIRLDLLYVNTWSLRSDLTILLRTVPAVLRRRGAH